MANKQTFETLELQLFNTAEHVGTFDAGSPEWHDARKNGIGGSDVGTILGLNPWESAFGLWAKRTGQIPDPPVDNWSIRFGNAFEEPILKMWAAENPDWEVFLVGTYRHKKHPHLMANPDAIARHKETFEWAIVEVKTARNPWSEVPPAYRAQVMHYMNVFQVSKSVIVGVAGWNWEEHWIDFDQFESDAQVAACNRFWDHLTGVVQPEWDGSRSTYEAQRQLNPFIEDDEVDLGDAGRKLVRLQSKFDEAEKALTKAKSEVLGLMGSARHGLVDGVRVTSRQARGNGTPWLVIKKGSK